ncbi:MAG: YheU family protein [Proteobacteria bacterium]|nr:YheU family protein [Pseudomonadota bacterium]
MIIPHRDLSPETLRSLIEQFVSRDGPDSGHADVSLDRKIESVLMDLDRGIAVLVYDSHLNSCNILLKGDIIF